MLNHELRPLLYADAAVQTLLRSEYNVEFPTATLLKDNFNFVFGTENLILRFSPASKKSLSEITAELRWTRSLNEASLPVNKVVPAKSGQLYLTVQVAGQVLYLVVFVRSKGKPVTPEDWGTPLFEKLGTLTGQLHQQSLRFHPQVDGNFPHWHQHSKCACLDKLPKDTRALPQILEQLNQLFKALPREKDQYGVIHYDIHQGNYFLLPQGEEPTLFLFDFEMTCLGWYAQDVAVILYYASNLNAARSEVPMAIFEARFMEAFTRTYRQYMPGVALTAPLLQAHLLYRDLFVYAYVLDAWRGRALSAGDQRLIDQLEGNIAARSAVQGFA